MQTRSSYLQIIPLILNHFWRNLVHIYKMYLWTSLVLCVVFKCQYFWSYSRKTHFWPFIYLFLYTQNLFDWSDFFSTGWRHSNLFFLFLRSIQVSIFLELFKKNTFLTIYIYIFQRAVTNSKSVRLIRFFFYRFRTFQLSFFVL